MEDQGSQVRSEDVYAERIDRCVKNFCIKTFGCTSGGVLISMLMKGKSWPVVFGVAFGAGLGISNCNYEFANKLPMTKYPEYSSFKTEAAVDDPTTPLSFFDYIMNGKYKVADNVVAEKELEPPLPSWEENKPDQQNGAIPPQPYDHWGNAHWFPEQPAQPISRPDMGSPYPYVRDEYGRPQPNWNRNR